MKVLSEEVLAEHGPWKRVRQYIQGWVRVEGGVFIWGITGQETVVEKDVFRPKHYRRVVETVLIAS